MWFGNLTPLHLAERRANKKHPQNIRGGRMFRGDRNKERNILYGSPSNKKVTSRRSDISMYASVILCTPCSDDKIQREWHKKDSYSAVNSKQETSKWFFFQLLPHFQLFPLLLKQEESYSFFFSSPPPEISPTTIKCHFPFRQNYTQNQITESPLCTNWHQTRTPENIMKR